MKGSLWERMLPAPVNGGFRMDGYWVWDGSVIKGEDGRYHMFASRWPKKYPMHTGWLVASEIVRASCDTPGGTYQFEEVVLPARGPQYWDGIATSNPQIVKVGDKYVLYYMGTTHMFTEPEPDLRLDDPRVLVARANKRIGIAVSDSVFGPWKRFDKPIIETRPDKYDNFLVSNPAPCPCPDGKMLVIYKSRAFQEKPYKCTSIWNAYSAHNLTQRLGAVIADSFDGDYTKNRTDGPIFDINRDVEDPFVWYDEDGFNIMAKDMNGSICGEPLAGVHGISKDGLHWEFETGRPFYSRNVLWDDGVVRRVGNMERPFLLIENGKPTHAFFATSDAKGDEGVISVTDTWTMVIPLKD